MTARTSEASATHPGAISAPSGIDLPVGAPAGVQLPTTFKVNIEIHAHVRATRAQPRALGFHPSEMPRTCAAKHLIYRNAIDDFASTDPARIKEAMRLVRLILDTEHDVSPGGAPAHLAPDFDEGSAIGRYQQFRHGERGYLWGQWQCPHCLAKTPSGFMPRVSAVDKEGKEHKVAAPCIACAGANFRHAYGAVRWLYVEPFVGLVEWDSGGHVDGIWLKRQPDYILPAIMEIKSINENGYLGKYGEPLPKKEHVIQASQYVFAVRQHYPWLANLRHIYFVYVNKNALRETKEFLVEADMAEVARVQTMMSQILAARRGGGLTPALRLCPSIESVGATKCPVAEQCFGVPRPVNFFGTT